MIPNKVNVMMTVTGTFTHKLGTHMARSRHAKLIAMNIGVSLFFIVDCPLPSTFITISANSGPAVEPSLLSWAPFHPVLVNQSPYEEEGKCPKDAECHNDDVLNHSFVVPSSEFHHSIPA